MLPHPEATAFNRGPVSPRAVATKFSAAKAKEIGAIKYLRIRAGETHRFIAVWIVEINGRLFVRSWNDKPTGWFRAFLKEPVGAVEVDGKPVPVRGKLVTDPALNQKATDAYALKYTTTANLQYVEGFRSPKRMATTLELVPA